MMKVLNDWIKNGAVMVVALAMAGVAVAAEAEPTAAQMLKWVRINSSGQEMDTTGHLRTSEGKKVPFALRMDRGAISFSFTRPKETLTLDLSGGKQDVLVKDASGKVRKLTSKSYGQSIRGTDANFEDIALRFLFWESASFEKDPKSGKRIVESVATRDCFKIRANNPRREGPYAAVFAWVDRESGALMRVQGYNWQGKCVKQFEVISARKMKKGWVLKEMRIDRIDAGTGKVVARTWLYLDKARKKSSPLF
ncbi:outer membrane lipoprotein-sorting protein [Sulfuriroseicoccus oceanibius]|uniref:Outer membrane lipoprotein-sorting protein n=1 Tax=Sulfuriroseicoccus oceanibius TaxID=2707525 RepID=A0A6B3L402_9BACT|nr:outer membrane lipoprotein-sorting protein [Sulfuriroseicoccus oceanibius]QQL44507.1 outer membrane lipoprotein-sorting protein [Sulfuriroseicoccus oceanibius]